MRLLIYDIQHPTDPQVNGFALYRTVVDGTEYLLIEREAIPDNPTYSGTHPWEASDCDDETLFMVWTLASSMATSNLGAACTATQQFENETYPHSNSEDSNGYRCSHRWEIRHEWGDESSDDITQTHFTWAYSTTTADSGLGSAVEFDNNIPPKCSLCAEFLEHLFLAGDPDNPHYLYYSKRYRVESYPSSYYVEIGDANDPITALAPIAGVLGVFSRDTKYRVSGNATSGFQHFEAISHRGTRAPKSCIPTDKGVIFVANDGVFTTNFIAPDTKISQDIEALFTQDTVSEERPINMTYAHLIAGCYYKMKYRFVYADIDHTAINREAVYDFDIAKWYINDISVASYYVEEDIDTLTGGGQDYNLYNLTNGVLDVEAPITYTWWSKEFSGDSYNIRNLFRYFKIDCEIPAGETATATFYVDGTLVQTTTISGTRTQVLNPLPENTVGSRWQLRLTGTTHAGGVKLYGVAAYFMNLRPM